MKKLAALVSGLCWQAACLAAAPEFYVVNISSDNTAVLHTTVKAANRSQKRPFIVLGDGRQACCFNASPLSKAASSGGEALPVLVAPEGEESFRFPGTYRPAGGQGSIDDFAFGLGGMTGATKVGKDAYEVRLANGPAVIVRHCNGMEGINFKLYRALRDKQPFATYYYALGYDIEPDCPGR